MSTFEEIQEERNKLIKKDTPRVYFFDLNKSGIVLTNQKNEKGLSDLGMLVNSQAVVESVYNILLTQPGERVMNPRFGCDLNQYMFEMVNDVTAFLIMRTISEALNQFETRINNVEVIVEPKINDNTFIIEIYFNINTANEPVKLITTLEKVR